MENIYDSWTDVNNLTSQNKREYKWENKNESMQTQTSEQACTGIWASDELDPGYWYTVKSSYSANSVVSSVRENCTGKISVSAEVLASKKRGQNKLFERS